MPNQELLDFIKKSKEAGQGDEEIEQALKSAGWQEGDINEGFLSSINSSAPSITSEKPAQNYSDVLYGIKQGAPVIAAKGRSGKKLITAIIIIIILLAAAAAAYYFKDDLKNLPIINNLIKKDGSV